MRTKANTLAILGAAVLVLAAACNKSESPAPRENTTTAGNVAAPAATTADTASGAPEIGGAKAHEIFKSRCATCHGNEGRGDGPGAITLNPKPRNYHDKEWQAKVTDDEITKAITYGGAAIGKSPAMPGNPDLDSQPQVVAALVHIVRGFGK
jgi:mono/diheme cytochrome c family protein